MLVHVSNQELSTGGPEECSQAKHSEVEVVQLWEGRAGAKSVQARQNDGGMARLIWPSILNLGVGKVWGMRAFLGGNSQSTINCHQKLKMISSHKLVS